MLAGLLTLVGMLVALSTHLSRLPHKQLTSWQRIYRRRLYLLKHTVNYAAVMLVILQVHIFPQGVQENAFMSSPCSM